MYKIFLSFVFAASLNAQMIDGVSIVVKGSAITLYDVKEEMKKSKSDAKGAVDILIRKKLEEQEITERKIEVSSSEVYEDIKRVAEMNNLSISAFYDAVRNSNGMSSTELKESIKERLLSQKLYSAIAYSQLSQPSEEEIKEYYELNKADFSHPSAFVTIINNSSDKARLQEKIDNPMFYAPDIQTDEQTLEYAKISPDLASLLEKTPLNTFTPVVPNGNGGFISFYIKEIKSSSQNNIESAKNQIMNIIMAKQREEVLGDYFARLRHNADIKILRMPE